MPLSPVLRSTESEELTRTASHGVSGTKPHPPTGATTKVPRTLIVMASGYGFTPFTSGYLSLD